MTQAQWIPALRPCPVCGGSTHRVLGSRGGAAHHSGAGVSTTIVRCRSCHAVYPRPFLLPTGNPYEHHSSDEYFGPYEPARKEATGAWLGARAGDLLGRTGKLLEIGCGRGEILAGAASAGWAVCGVEMTESYSHAARSAGLKVETAPVESCRSLDETWDVVLLTAVLEHLYEPRQCLARIHAALSPGGVVFVDVPNECSLWTRLANAYMRVRGRRWVVNLSPTFPPYHVVGFCTASLRRLAVELGFEMLEMRTHRWRNQIPKPTSLTGHIEGLGAEVALTLGAWIGSGAGITAWLRKPRPSRRASAASV